MAEMEERDLLLASLKGYLEELQDTGLDELLFAAESRPSVGADRLQAVAGEPSVTGAGNQRARLLFVGSGVGFSGPSGELFSKVVQAMGFATEEVYLLSFPPVSTAEASPSRESLLSRIAAVAPQVAVALGEPAAQLLLGSGESISNLRGRFHDMEGVTVMATLHPDQLLADQSLKRQVWNEMRQVMGRLKAE